MELKNELINSEECSECETTSEEEAVFEESSDLVIEKPENDPGKPFGLTSMIIGISSLVITLCCSTAGCLAGFAAADLVVLPFSFVSAIVGLIFSIIANKKSKEFDFKNSFAKVGLITSIFGIVFSILFVVLLILSVVGVLAIIALDNGF